MVTNIKDRIHRSVVNCPINGGTEKRNMKDEWRGVKEIKKRRREGGR